jgi:dihydroneopterin aldolase
MGEQDVERVFLVDLAVHLDLHPAITHDRLEDALDFTALANLARAMVAGPSKNLMETLTAELAQAILTEFPRVDQVRVRVAKPHPTGLDAEQEAVEISLGRT